MIIGVQFIKRTRINLNKNIMKTLVVTLAILSSLLTTNSYAREGLNIQKKLKKDLKFEHSSLPIQKNHPQFVKVSFKINEVGKIQILEMNYSDEKIKTQLTQKLLELTVEEQHNPEEVYYYNFVFQKL